MTLLSSNQVWNYKDMETGLDRWRSKRQHPCWQRLARKSAAIISLRILSLGRSKHPALGTDGTDNPAPCRVEITQLSLDRQTDPKRGDL